MTNQRLGKVTENLFLEKVAGADGFATIIPPTHLGQPVDVVAVIKSTVFFVDIKHCSAKRFNFGAIQDNQPLSMEKIWKASGRGMVEKGKNIKVGFMIFFEPLQAFRFLSYGMYRSMLANDEKSVKMDDETLEFVDLHHFSYSL